jgi:hypothetical protein
MLAETAPAVIRPIHEGDSSATRVDMALLVSALFLQRFSLPFGPTRLQLDLVGIGLILFYQFVSGKLLISYPRFLWFLAFAFACSYSLWLNFKSAMLPSYLQTLVLFSLFMLSRSSTPDQYKNTLQAFQFLILLLCCLAVLQFPAQFVVDGSALMNFYWKFPKFLNVLDPTRIVHGSLLKSNGIFLAEPSALSEMAALGIVIEVLEFRRPRYLVVMALGLLLAYSGTGIALLLLFLPLASLRHDRALPYGLLAVIFAVGFFATGMIDLSAFTSRTGELEAQGSSGYSRFVAPFLMAAKKFNLETLQELPFGSGPGTAKIFASTSENIRSAGGLAGTWMKIFHEYGIIGLFMHGCFLAGCLRRSRCPGLVIAAIIFSWLFLQGIMTIAIPLCTLSGPQRWRARIDESRQDRSFAAGRAERQSDFLRRVSSLARYQALFNSHRYQEYA